ncbi:probable receptor-like protein kinase At1g80640 isoform X2 [Impatiens glandulifera]|uniref:probable receptor-like protein kinase At1g80640 isoform X2 n=1 Tax=Impatiens glandulifera TaxID=253017 RepID=UPI001FB07420|nr:probable receptor-like protein kinase At1g80640 isoform X2 [Impatiens glandulifera]
MKKKKQQHFLGKLGMNRLIPIWVFTYISIISICFARLEPPIPSIADPVLPTEKQLPFPQISPQMEPEVRIVHHQDLNKKILVALVVASSLLGGTLLSMFCLWICKEKFLNSTKSKQKQQNQYDAPPLKGKPVVGPIMSRFNSLKIGGKKTGSIALMDYELLVAATNNFEENNVIGKGRFGHVYKACFNSSLSAAVKTFEHGDFDAQKEFQKEVDWLSKIQHHNIVSLLGYCIHGQTRILVYEMMHNGSLDFHLHGPSQGSALTWHVRMKIALDIARGLEFLHENCHPVVIHRDIKSSNILLDLNFNAKISHFGLAISGGTTNKNNVKLPETTPGYVAPEYLSEGKLTDKSDVYAFGIILLELLMGRRPVEETSEFIVNWQAMPQLTDRTKLPKIVDPVIQNTMDVKHLYQVAAVAVLCVQQEPSYRPLITDVLHSLIPLVPLELGGSLRVQETA